MLPFIARTLYHIQERMLGRDSFAILKQLRQSQWWPRERLEALQLQRLQDLTAKAYEHSPYWRSIMTQHGVQPADVRSLADLQRFPLLTKRQLRESSKDMVWLGGGHHVRMGRTSGSTNEPLEFFTSAEREAHVNAARMRGHESVGMFRGEKELYFWGSPVEISKQDKIKSLRDWLINDGFTDAFHVNADQISEHFNRWLRFRPKCIFCYPSSLAMLAEMAEQQHIDLSQLRNRGLRMIVATAEVLEGFRDAIQQAFHVPVYDSYGLREAGLIGHECEHQNMHCVEEQVLLETMDPNTLEPTSGEGELVVTNLVGHVMPVLRYRTGDIVTLNEAPCACGRSLRHIKVTGGRTVDFIVTSKGLWLSGFTFVYLHKHIPGIVKLQVQQDRIGEVRVLLVTNDKFGELGEKKVRHALKQSLQCNDNIIIQQVDAIPPCPSGKHRLVIGRVAEQLRAKNATSSRPNKPEAKPSLSTGG
jgi:phenylacetate-CoA ligase